MQLRKDFVDMFTKDRIKNLTPEEYFPGPGNKENCTGYQLEWATIPHGIIKGGSMAKYGAKEHYINCSGVCRRFTRYDRNFAA
jgi:hypothetical protein